ncbi:MAG: HRDC domain-containing protein [Gemmatimonadaceae bacterium]
MSRAVPPPTKQASTTYLDSPDAVKAFAESISTTKAIAVDTEGASFHRYVDRIYLLQLSTASRHAIIDPLKVDPSDALTALLHAPDVEVVFHDADYDLRLMHQDYGWRVTRIFDTRVAAQLLGIKAFGLAALLESHFGVRLDKTHQRADWSMRPLTREMLDYAAQDTRHLLPLRDALRAQLEKKGRWTWAEEEFKRLEGTRWEGEDSSTAFLRLKGARDLSRRELALLRELVAWRDTVARAQDRSTFRVAGNEVLFDLARRAPADIEALRTTKGLSRSIVEREGPAVLEAIRRGQAVPDQELPRFPRAPRWDRDPEFEDRVGRLKAVRDSVAAELELDPGVLCPRERLEGIARKRPTSTTEMLEVPDMRRWQVELLGDAFLRALGSGRAASAKNGIDPSNGGDA